MSSAKLQSPLSSKQLQRRPRNQQSVNSGKSETVPEAQELVVTQGPIVTKKFHDKSELEVIFEGSKILWKLRTSIDICFALHKYTVVHIIEIVAFHPTLSEESNRIYVSLPLLESKLDENLLQARIEAKKESLTRQKKAVRLDDIRKEIQLNLMVDFLLSRVDAPRTYDGVFTIILAPHGSDLSNPSNLEITCEMPSDLDPYEAHFKHKLSVSEKHQFHHKLHDIQENTILLHEANGLAELALDHAASAADILNAKLNAQKAAAERRARAWQILQHFAKLCRVIIARKMVEKFRIRLAQMENPSFQTAPLRRSVKVTKAMQQAQIESHRVFMAAAAAAAAAATCSDFNNTVTVEDDNASVNSTASATVQKRGSMSMKTPSRRGSIADNNGATGRRALSRRGSMNEGQARAATAGSFTVPQTARSSFRVAQQMRRSMIATELFPCIDSPSGTPTSSAKMLRSSTMEKADWQVERDSLKLEESRMHMYESLKRD